MEPSIPFISAKFDRNGDMLPVIERARSDIEEGMLWRARNRLEGFVGSQGYHREVVELLGEVCYRMGDYPAAGRFWFFTQADSDAKHLAIETFVRQHGGRPEQMLSQLPKNLRDCRPTRFPFEARQRLEKLQAASPRRQRKRKRNPTNSRNQAADTFAFLIVGAIALFFLYCFSLGVVQVMRALL